MPASFRRTAILGTGLIGGSFALALRRWQPEMAISGWDHPEVLREAHQRGAIHECVQDIAQAVNGADLIYVALPVGLGAEILPEIARHASPSALVTDACSTKRSICSAAAKCFTGQGARFLGGHPMAGKEVSGIAAAEADLFRGAKYALIRGADGELPRDARVAALLALIEGIGAEPVWLDAATHDQAAAMVSHLPQLLAVALAGVVRKQTDDSGFPVTLAGRGLRDALRLAGSPYSIWRDIILTNSDHIDAALGELIESLQRMRSELRTSSLQKEFAAAGELYKMLQELQEQ